MREQRGKSRRLVAILCLIGVPPALAEDWLLPDQPLVLPAIPVDDWTDTPVLKLDLPLGAVKPAHRVRRPKKVLAVPDVSDEPVALAEGPLAFDFTGPAPKDLSGGAVLKLDLPAGAVKAEAKASLGKKDGETAFWHKDTARLSAELNGPLGMALNVTGEKRLELTYRTPESVGAADGVAHIVRTESRIAGASLTLPLDPLRLTMGGQGTDNLTQEGAPGSNFAQSAVVTTDQSAYADLEWQPLPLLKFKGGAVLRTAGIRLHDTVSGSYRAVGPSLTATVTPLSDTTISAKVEETMAPFDAAAFAGYARAEPTGNVSGFQPDHAWQMETRVEQRLGAADITATYTAARDGTVTEFAVVGGRQAPATTPLVGRESLAVAIRLPLVGIGLSRTDFSSEARWHSSRVIDPVTAAERAASGEAAETLSLRLKHDLPAGNLSFGLSGEYTGARSTFQVNQLSTTEAGGTVGAFVSFQPGSYHVDLSVGGLVGAATRDTFYKGVRGASDVERTAIKDHSGATLSLSLKKRL